jgi:hypothetical protein
VEASKRENEKMCPIYQYRNEKTKEIFEVLRKIDDRNEPYLDKNGTKCERIEIPENLGYCGVSLNEREIWDLERDYVKKCSPKFVKTRSGKKIRYDKNSMGY